VAIPSSLELALAHYDLGELWSCRPIEHGYVNELWRIETTLGRYVLRRRHPSLRDRRTIEAQHALIQHLRQAGFPSPRLVRTRHSVTFLELGDEVYEVQAYIPGELCDAGRPAHLAAAAFTLGWYHDAVRGIDHPALHRTAERYGAVALEQIVGRLMQDWQGKLSARLATSCEALQTHVAGVRAFFKTFSGLPELVIHGDYYGENLILQDDLVAGVVDYDGAHWCTRAMEVAEALVYFCREPERRFKHIVYSGALDLGAIERFLAAYSDAATLSEVEVRALPDLIRTIWLCASLDPPMQARLSEEDAPRALPEVLALADWAQAHATELVAIGLATRTRADSTVAL
jgi:Ser/Thr protein kinase RdoA (MazF antagonist)